MGGSASGDDLGACVCVHAEQNIISYCARNGIAMQDTTLYLPCNPCLDCMKLVVSSGVHEIIYAERYPATFITVRVIAEKSGVVLRQPNCTCA